MSSALHPDRKNNPDLTSSNESGNASLHALIETGRPSRRAFLQRSLAPLPSHAPLWWSSLKMMVA